MGDRTGDAGYLFSLSLSLSLPISLSEGVTILAMTRMHHTRVLLIDTIRRGVFRKTVALLPGSRV